jgi:hypothetical protein
MKKILLLDTNFSANPISDKLIELGYEVFRVGKLKNQNRKKEFENLIDLDYSDIRSVVNFCKSKNISKVVPGCTDLSFKASNIIGSILEIPEYINRGSIDHLLNKKSLAKFLAEYGLPHPITLQEFKSIPLDVTHIKDWIIKPEVGFSGKDIMKIEAQDVSIIKDLRIPTDTYSNSILQEFVVGNLYSFSGILADYKIVQCNIVYEECEENTWKVNLSFVDLEFPKNYLKELIELTERIAKISGKSTGLIHIQFILSEYGPKILEIIERMPGDLYSQLIEFSGCNNYVKGFLSHYIRINNFTKCDSTPAHPSPIVRITTKMSVFQNFLKVKRKDIKVIEYTKVERFGSNPQNEDPEMVIFLNFDDFTSLKTWINSNPLELLLGKSTGGK